MSPSPGLARRALLALVCLPTNLLTWVALAFLRAFAGRSWSWQNGCLVVVLDPATWFSRRLYVGWGGTALGPAAVMLSGSLDPTFHSTILRHELVHVEQSQAAAIAGLLVAGGLVASGACWWAGLAAWAVAPWVAYAGAMGAAALRGEPAYLGNHLEEAARAVVETVSR
jgi:hypothetical protein